MIAKKEATMSNVRLTNKNPVLFFAMGELSIFILDKGIKECVEESKVSAESTMHCPNCRSFDIAEYVCLGLAYPI